MSAAENRKLMEAIFAGIAQGDSALFVASLSDDVTLRVTGQYSWSRTFVGKASVLRDLFGHVRSLVQKGGRTVAHRFIADGDFVVVEARGDMVTKAGVPYANDYCLVYRLQDGRIVEMTEYNDSILCERVLGPFPTPAQP
jgi:uncharacterized protein